ncbi:MAG: ferrous iron transport protein B [Armatimonadetes bacterium]|nr:ferrous iron transport protein B [Armatimonadota bacterium]
MTIATTSKVGKKTITVAVSGNPNSGKSTLINGIAGTRLQVGNWPGVTVDKKEALLEYGDKAIRLVDLPGTYSLSPYSQEEVIARDYLIREKPDVIIDVVDSTNLERNLYLAVQLLELDIPVVIALNMHDEAEKKGYKIDTKPVEEMLGARVVPTVATRNEGTRELLEAVAEIAEDPLKHRPRTLSYGDDIETAAATLETRIRKDYPAFAEQYPLRWLALKILEEDNLILGETGLRESLAGEALHHLKKAHSEDMESVMADARYALASGLTREVLKVPEIRKAELTEKIDKIVLNRFLAMPIFLASMWLVFKLAFDTSKPFVDWIDLVTTGPLKRWAEAIAAITHSPAWLSSLTTDGVIGGVGFVLAFVPVIFAMMFFITFLEGSGYMARAAFVMDRAMHKMGLHGKSFIPMLLGFGCNVPAIYATRTLENTKDKVLTSLVIPLMSCGARLPVYVLFVGAFFSTHAGTAIWSMYVLGIAIAVLMGVIFKKTLFKGESPIFIMELPPYRMPTAQSLLIHTWEKGRHFLIKAGTYIFAVSILVWFLLNLPWGVADKKDSLLGRGGQIVAPLLAPLGFGNWEAASSLITGVVAKEIVVGTMGEIYTKKAEEAQKEPPPPLSEDLREICFSFFTATKNAVVNVFSTFKIVSLAAEEDPEGGNLRSRIRAAFTPLSGYSFMVFVLLYTPCIVTAIAFRHEFGTWKWFGVACAYQTVLAWLVSFVIYQGGKLMGLGG